MKKSPEVDAYVAAAPEEHQSLLKKLRAMIHKAIPKAEETLESKMPVYKIDGDWYSGLAWRSKGVMLYVCKTQVVDQFEAKLGKHRSGKSCVLMVPSKTHSAAQLEKLAGEMLAALGKLA